MKISLFITIFIAFLMNGFSAFNLNFTRDNDTISDHYWKFPENHPYQYFSSTKDIPHSYLPIQVDSIPQREGVWILRNKEFSSVPKYFQVHEAGAGDPSKSIIHFSSKALLFHSVTVKALSFGRIDFVVHFPDYNGNRQNASLFELKNCTNGPIDRKNGPKWVTYEIQIPQTAGKMTLEAAVHHSDHTFMILDEVVIGFKEYMRGRKDESEEDESGPITFNCTVSAD